MVVALFLLVHSRQSEQIEIAMSNYVLVEMGWVLGHRVPDLSAMNLDTKLSKLLSLLTASYLALLCTAMVFNLIDCLMAETPHCWLFDLFAVVTACIL
jgi:hypothetical protein